MTVTSFWWRYSNLEWSIYFTESIKIPHLTLFWGIVALGIVTNYKIPFPFTPFNFLWYCNKLQNLITKWFWQCRGGTKHGETTFNGLNCSHKLSSRRSSSLSCFLPLKKFREGWDFSPHVRRLMWLQALVCSYVSVGKIDLYALSFRVFCVNKDLLCHPSSIRKWVFNLF